MGIVKKLFNSESTEKENSIDDIMDDIVTDKIKNYFNNLYNDIKNRYIDQGYNQFETLLLVSLELFKLRDTSVDITATREPVYCKNSILADNILLQLDDTLNCNGFTYNKTLRYILKYALFLALADQLTMYNNSDEEYIFSTIKGEEIKLQVILDNYKIGFLFTNDIIKNSNNSNLLEEFVSGKQQSGDYFAYVELNKGNYKKGFNLSINEAESTYKTWSDIDKVMFDIAINNTISMIEESYMNILNESFKNYTGISIDKNWKEYFESWT